MSQHTRPLLYTFRRCPYAIRARLAIQVSGITVDMHEVDLRHKPPALLACSPKGTVPVLQRQDGSVIEESLDIMRWALDQHDPQGWLQPCQQQPETSHALLTENDGAFKQMLDRYKYPERHSEYPQQHYRAQAEQFLHTLNVRLTQHPYLLGAHPSLVDAAIVPFIRQCARIDQGWFDAAPYPALIRWLNDWLASDLFKIVMQKHMIATPAITPVGAPT